MVKNINRVLLDFFNNAVYKRKMFLKLLFPLLMISCSVPYNYSYITDAVQGKVSCERKLVKVDDGTDCYCKSYDKIGNKCEQSPILKLWLLDPSATYDYEETDKKGMVCKTGYSIDDFGFCGKNASGLTGKDDWKVVGSEISTFTEYSHHESNVFYINSNFYICRTYIHNNENEAIVNCRTKKDNNSVINFYSKITVDIGYSIKDVFFALYSDGEIKAQQAVLAYGSGKLYLDYQDCL